MNDGAAGEITRYRHRQTFARREAPDAGDANARHSAVIKRGAGKRIDFRTIVRASELFNCR